MFIERLEERRLMSAGVTATVGGDGMLTVAGTLEADVIDVFEVGGNVTVIVNQDADHPLFFGHATGVKIDSKGGNDVISYTGNTLDATIYLKNGTDFLQISALGTCHAMVYGGNGDDIVLADGNVTVNYGN